MKNNKYIWLFLIIISIILFVLAFIKTDGIKCYILILISFYIFMGSTLKLYKINIKFKNTIDKIINTIFWFI